MNICVVGCNYKEFNCLEMLSKLVNHYFNNRYKTNYRECFLPLLTCNRVEIYFSSNNLNRTLTNLLNEIPPDVKELVLPNLYYYFGEECFKHLTFVSSGLESKIIGETEIQGQVKKHYELACLNRPLSPEIHYLFQKGMAISKKIRSSFTLGRGMPDLEHIVLGIGNETFPKNEEINVLFIGASDINAKIAKHMKVKGLKPGAVCNRTLENAEKFAQEYETTVLPWDDRHLWDKFHWIISGVTISDYLFTNETIKGDWDQEKIAFDLGIPRNIQPDLGEHCRLQIYDIEHLGKKVEKERVILTSVLEEIKKIIEEKVRFFIKAYEEKASRLRETIQQPKPENQKTSVEE